MHAILHSFTYPLKPLTQASISIQPIPILHATHNHVLPYPCVHPFNHTTKLVSFSKPSPTCGILPKKYHVALSPLHTQTVPIATRDITHSIRVRILSCRRSTFSGYLTSEILSDRRSHLLRISHIRNSVRPKFYLLRISHIRNFVRPTPHLLRISHIRNYVRPTFHLIRMREEGDSISPVRHVRIL